MIKQFLRILIALIGVAGLGITAKAQAVDQIEVNIPFEFAVNGKTLPAGNYRVDRVFNNSSRALILSGFDNNISAMVLPSEVSGSYADKAQVTFEQAGDQHFLSKIETAKHSFNIPVPRAEVMQALAKLPSGTSFSSSETGSK